MVVDPGCMKCLDCVSVCPNDALSFSFAKPTILAKPRHTSHPAAKAPRPAMDLSWPEEIVIFLLTIGLFVAFRGMLNQIPLLMAAGMAMITGFGAWKLWRLIRDPNVRVQNFQMKLKGRLTRAGWVAGLVFLTLISAGAWSGWIKLLRLRADLIDGKVTTPYDVVMSSGYKPIPADKRLADRAIELYRASGPPRDGGFGWGFTPDQLARLAWLSAVAGDLASAETYLNTSINLTQPSDSVVIGLAQFMTRRGKTAFQVEHALANVAEKYPEQFAARITLARVQAAQGRVADASCEALAITNDKNASLSDITTACELLIDIGRPVDAVRVLTHVANTRPANALVEASLARALYFSGAGEAAIGHMEKAAALAPDNPAYWGALGELLAERGRDDEAARARAWSDMLVDELRKAQPR
jgi:tetratricopeptide (TPR) repeat protein